MEDKKFKRIVICIVLAVGIVFGFLALLNGRYTTVMCGNVEFVWDKWTKEMVYDECETLYLKMIR